MFDIRTKLKSNIFCVYFYVTRKCAQDIIEQLHEVQCDKTEMQDQE